MALTYGQLPQQPHAGVTLYCPECAEHYSAYRGDYFMADPRTEIRCGACLGPLQLVRRHHAPQRTITPAEARSRRLARSEGQ